MTGIDLLKLKREYNRMHCKYGFWFDMKVTDDNDDLIDLECHVYVTEELDPLNTGDSPTEYEVDIISVLHENTYYDIRRNHKHMIIDKAITEYKGELI